MQMAEQVDSCSNGAGLAEGRSFYKELLILESKFSDSLDNRLLFCE